MRLYEIREMAERLLIGKGLYRDGWRFEFDNAVRRFGCCKYRQKCITMSRKLAVIATDDDIRNNVLHEIAHALAGPGKGHGPEWKRIAVEIGCTGDRCHTLPTHHGAKYVMTCPKCEKTWHRHRKPKHGLYGYKCPCGYSFQIHFERTK